MKPIDTHVHLYEPNPGYSWPAQGTPFYRVYDEGDLRAAHGGALGSAVLVGCSPEAGRTLELLERYKDVPDIGAVIGETKCGEGFAELYQKCAEYPKFRGFRTSYKTLATEAGEAALRVMNGKRANIMELLGSWETALPALDAVDRFGGVRFVAQHFGCPIIDGAPMPEGYRHFLRALAARPNAYIKLSGLLTLTHVSPIPADADFYRPYLEAAIEAFGEDRCMYGSDWPVAGMKADYPWLLETVDAHLRTLPGEAREKMLWRNARDFYAIA